MRWPAWTCGPEEIDVVIPSHLHLDHIGWNTRPGPDGEPVITFPNARYMFHKGDWDRFTDPVIIDRAGSRSRAWRGLPTRACCRSTPPSRWIWSTTDANVTSEVKILHTPGHTPGSVSVLVESGGESVIFIGDVAHLCVQLTEYDWSPLGDVDRETVARSRASGWWRKPSGATRWWPARISRRARCSVTW